MDLISDLQTKWQIRVNWIQELDVGGEGLADAVEGLVDAAGQTLHSDGCGESDECDDQCVFNQVLTLFAFREVLEFQVETEEHPVHVGFLL